MSYIFKSTIARRITTEVRCLEGVVSMNLARCRLAEGQKLHRQLLTAHAAIETKYRNNLEGISLPRFPARRKRSSQGQLSRHLPLLK